MRLRYLHIPRCGPLIDTTVIFGHEDLVTRALNLPRRGSLNFLVGVNGSGKSSLLRAIYGIFRSLKQRERPALPVTLAWDRMTGSNAATALLHATGRKDVRSFFAAFKPLPALLKRHEWEAITYALASGEPHSLVEDLEMVSGPEAFTSTLILSRLPKHLIAYTSGDVELWEQLDQPVFHPVDGEEGQYRTDDERPPGWSMDQEWEKESQLRITKGIQRSGFKTSGNVHFMPSAGQWEELSSETMTGTLQKLKDVEVVRQKVSSNLMSRKDPLDNTYFRIDPQHLRFAGIILSLWQTAKDMSGRAEEGQRQALRNELLRMHGSTDRPQDARRVLNEIDLFWPTHLSITYRDAEDRVTPRQHQELLCLAALADEVIAQPLGSQRAVFSLGPSDDINLTQKLKDALLRDLPNKDVELIANRVDGCRTGAEAILRVFSADRDIDSTPLDVFSRLRDWERTGLLADITTTVKRLHITQSADGEPDDIIVTYDQLSDGERMLLGRMGMLFLLRGQDGSLFLLDEPETHFNDVWKREIVEMLDMSLLNSTAANVVISTHTSIALTDAFAAEVTVLDKTEDGITARSVTGGLFGTDPGEVNMNLFRADASIGRRSEELLDQLLKTEWKDRETELAEILDVLGSSFHRAELRAILKNLRTRNDGPTSR
jgi:ABC-type multidrug transport system ATPase subunit